MRVLVAGATGVVGRPLVGALRARGHQVTALVREESRARAPEADAVVVADALGPRRPCCPRWLPPGPRSSSTR